MTFSYCFYLSVFESCRNAVALEPIHGFNEITSLGRPLAKTIFILIDDGMLTNTMHISTLFAKSN